MSMAATRRADAWVKQAGGFSMNHDFHNPVRQKLKNGQKPAGAFLQIPHSIPAEIFSMAGFDWLIVDMEHAPGDYGDLLGQLQAISGSGTVPFVRPPWNDDVAIKKILDCGADEWQ